MKKLILISILLVSVFVTSKAQSPQSFQYQAVVRDASGVALANQSVSFQISIISGSPAGTVEYVESHAAVSNSSGIVTLPIGSGIPVSGLFSSINWGQNSYFVKIEADPLGGTSYLDMGTTQLLSVPYALYAKAAGNAVSINWLGTLSSAPLSPNQNDAYYNSTDAKSYIWNGAVWQILSQDGVQGLQGPQGIPGNDGLNGADGTNGVNGTNGINGFSVLSGSIDPTSQGSDGDFYINTTTSTIFGPKTAGSWGAGVSLIGSQGPQGIQGPAGTGLTNRGNWLSGTSYTDGDYVFDRSTGNPLVNSMWICQTTTFISTVQPYLDAVHWVEFQAPAGPQGTAGTNGTNGYSVLNGTVNPTTEGVNGDFYINTSTNMIYGPKTSGIWGTGTSIIGPQGPIGLTGAAGATGPAGVAGTNGYSVLSGTSNPTSQGVNGDFYINTTTSTIFGPKTAGVWGSGISLIGPTGAAGTNGTAGTNGYSVLSGTVVPTTQGVNGDFYINTVTSTIYGPKTAGLWGSGTALIGPQGPAGATGATGATGLAGTNGFSVLSGISNPTTQGVNGDFYINTTTNTIFGPKTAGAWGTGVALVGPTGATGATGAAGANGNSVLNGTVAPTSQGVNGDFYVNTTTNTIYGPKTAGIWGSGTSLVGPAGATGATGATGAAGIAGTNGNTVLSGTVNPTTQGANGDFYINTTTNTIFGPKTAGVWGSGTPLVGPQGIAGTNGANGTNGTNGTNGYSVLNGTSNPTTQGVNGDFYINTTTNTIFGPKTSGIWGSGTSLVGPQGLQGVQGPAGTGLTNRGNWLSGSTYSNGDYVFDRSTGSPTVNSMWICQTASFTSTIQPYQDAVHWVEFQAPAGPQGIAGTNGADGKTILNGTVNPTTQGVNGDFYINTTTNTIFGPKTAGTWGSGVSLIGPQGSTGVTGANGANGTNGYSVLSGTLNPTTQGVNGDFYINTTTSTIFGPKTAGVWGTGTALIGPQGPTGATGATGANGATGATGPAGTNGYSVLSGTVNPTSQGVNGDFYINTSTNTIFGPKTAGVWGTGTSLVGPAGTYTAGSGIQISAGTITNTSPDQTVAISAGTGMSVTGTYPSFTVTNANPNATHTGDVTGATALTIANNAVTTTKIADANVTAAKLSSMSATSGQVLKYNGTNWAPSSDLNTGTPGGVNKTVQFNNSGSFGGDTAMIWDNTNKRFGIGTTSPSGRVVIKGSATASASEPLFEIRNSNNQQIMAVYNDSVQFFITDIASNRGGFAVSGRNNSKALTNDFLRINADSTRIYTTDTTKGFGVRSLGTSSKLSYMQINPLNNFIGHLAGYSLISNALNTGKYNSFLGYKAGYSNTSGNKNYFIGYKAGYSNTNGLSNIFIGDSTGLANTTGRFNIFMGNQSGLNSNSSYNVFLGYQSGMFNTSGANNAFIGYLTGRSNTTGASNVFIGNNAGYSNVNGNYNIYLGRSAGYFGTSGSNNVFLGYYTGYYNIDGINNVFLGNRAGFNNKSGGSNVYLGNYSGYNDTTGTNNVFLGYYSGYSNYASNNVFLGYESGRGVNSTGSSNTFLGYKSGRGITTGYNNVFLGDSSGVVNTTGYSNVFIGDNAGSANTTGYRNVFIGESSGASNINGYFNVYIGFESGQASTGGDYNTLIGYHTGSNLTGSYNVAIGKDAGLNWTSATSNIAIGNGALKTATGGIWSTAVGFSAATNATGSGNTVFGAGALGAATTGISNVAVGWLALSDITTGSSNTALGTNAFTTGTIYSNSTALGSNANITASNQVRLGDANVTSIGGYAAWSNLSDKRFKKDVVENVPGLDFILNLKPVTYHLDMDKIAEFTHLPDSMRSFNDEKIKGQMLQTGFIAQDVEKTANEIGFDFSGVDKPKNDEDFYSLRYSEFTVPLVKAVQELNQKNEKLQQENNEQKNLIDELMRRIELLENKSK